MSTFEPDCTSSLKHRRYGAIYADPPWSFRNWSAKGTGRNAVSHYDCLDRPALAALPIADLAADDCALFLWATDPLLPAALEMIRAWGFEYKTVGFYWVKLNAAAKHGSDFFTGLGYWTRRIQSSVSWRPGASRGAAQRVSAGLWSSRAVSTAANRSASESELRG